MSKRATIPYNLKEPSNVICYENDESQPVRMGDIVSITVFRARVSSTSPRSDGNTWTW